MVCFMKIWFGDKRMDLVNNQAYVVHVHSIANHFQHILTLLYKSICNCEILDVLCMLTLVSWYI